MNIVDRIADGDRTIVEHVKTDGSGQLLAKLRHELADGINNRDSVSARLSLYGHRHAATPIKPTGDFVVLNAVDHRGDLAQAHRRAIPVGDYQRLELLGILQLNIALQRQILIRAVECADGSVWVAAGDRGGHFIDTDSAISQRVRIQLGAHCELHCAINLDLRNSFDH